MTASETCITDGFQTLLSIRSDRILDTDSDRWIPAFGINNTTTE